MITLSERIELERRNRKPAEVYELNLDNAKASTLEGLTDKYVNVQCLSLVNCGLQSLDGFPSLEKLIKLDLSDNKLSGSLEKLAGCSKLEQINLSGNLLTSIDSLQPLVQLPNLKVLDAVGCEVSDEDSYRSELFAMLPNLKYLDGFDKNNEEENESDDVANGAVPYEEVGGDSGDDEESDLEPDQGVEEDSLLMGEGELDNADSEDEEEEDDDDDDLEGDESGHLNKHALPTLGSEQEEEESNQEEEPVADKSSRTVKRKFNVDPGEEDGESGEPGAKVPGYGGDSSD